jgi:ADP-ribose pyrophosphatase
MKKWIFLCLLNLFSLQAHYYSDYFNLLEKHPLLGPLGDYKKGEIEIVTDPLKMDEIASQTGRKVGVIYKDKFWIWLNDAVKFPNGKTGVYGRLMWVKSLTGAPGVAVMPILPNGKIVLNLNYRHATRSWEFELPRGVINEGETPDLAAAREAKEETGLILDELNYLGEIAPDTGMTNTIAKVYLAKVKEKGIATPEDSEAIEGIYAFTFDELKEGFIKGYLLNDGHQIPLRDPFLSFALFQAILRHEIQ